MANKSATTGAPRSTHAEASHLYSPGKCRQERSHGENLDCRGGRGFFHLSPQSTNGQRLRGHGLFLCPFFSISATVFIYMCLSEFIVACIVFYILRVLAVLIWLMKLR